MRVLVTGGAGFIGSHVAEAMIAAGHDVTVIDDLSKGRRENVPAAARFHQVDIADSALVDIVADAQPDVVLHQAAQIDVRISVSDPLRDARANVIGTVNLLAACTAHRVQRVVFASSGGAIYGDTQRIPTPETEPCRPQSPYGASKCAGEVYGEMFERNGGPEFVALRYSNVYGPRQDPRGEAGVVAIFATRLLAGASAVINGDGRQTRDYVYVDDVVTANLAAISTAEPSAYNIGTGEETDVNELFARLRRAAGSNAGAIHGEAKPGEQVRSCVDVSKAAAGLSWRPQVGLDEGLSRTLDWFRRQR